MDWRIRPVCERKGKRRVLLARDARGASDRCRLENRHPENHLGRQSERERNRRNTAGDPEKSPTAVLEDKIAGQVRSKFILDASKILKKAVQHLHDLNVCEAYEFQNAVSTLNQRLVGEHVNCLLKQLIVRLDKSDYFNRAAAHKLNEKLEFLNFDE